MNGMTAMLESKVLPIANKLGNQRHLTAIKNGFIATMPMALVGAVVVMFNNVIIGSETLIGMELNKIGFYADTIQPFLDATIAPVFGQMWWGTLALGVIFTIFTISYSLAKTYGDDALSAGVIAVACYLTLLPQAMEGGDWGTIHWTSFGSQAIFAGLITAMFSAEIFCAIKRKGWVIKMPDQVPAMVSKAFSAVIPAFITIFVFATTSTIFLNVIGTSLPVWINEILQQPLMALGQSPISLMLIIMIQQIFWFFGIHGALIVGPALDLMYGPAMAANSEAILIHGTEPVHAITRNFADIYATHGGSGATFGLIIAIFLFSKRKDHKSLAKLSIGPGIFQINEPIIYGMPMVLNPIMAVPFIFGPPLLVLVGWFFTAVIPFAGFMYISPPWVTPPVLVAFLSSGGNIPATILSAATVALSVLMYAPFVLMANAEESVEETAVDYDGSSVTE